MLKLGLVVVHGDSTGHFKGQDNIADIGFEGVKTQQLAVM